MALAEAVGKGALPELKELALDGNQIGDEGAVALAEAVGRRAAEAQDTLPLQQQAFADGKGRVGGGQGQEERVGCVRVSLSCQRGARYFVLNFMLPQRPIRIPIAWVLHRPRDGEREQQRASTLKAIVVAASGACPRRTRLMPMPKARTWKARPLARHSHGRLVPQMM